ncbi:acyltransferase [Salinimicrobium sp. TH3]|uniref:acyltransferase n=1 Tax=Salinimicrobium sp. TH3 TaxID=2997342 RepID=UPI002274BAF8|nr:acyltransferase [Salinimicrobium sp. TH3]MCY2687959.1 acyltransferase [Salinimicrobium sp. TH3]
MISKETERQVLKDVLLGRDVKIYSFVNAYGCTVGDFSRIGTFVEIQKGASIGKNCKISSHTFICQGVTISDNVFVGHNVTFINDKFPRATNEDGSQQSEEDWECIETFVGEGASIGSSATILCGVKIGKKAIVGAGSIVTKDVPDEAVVAGNPARIIKYLNQQLV